MSWRLWWGRLLAIVGQVCAAGLLLTSAWLIVRATEQPPVLYLMVAIVGVRFFGFARTGLRYAERLVLHDVALRRVAELRVNVYQALESQPLRLQGLARRGDIVRRVVADVDAMSDRLLRIEGPWIVALSTTLVVSAGVGIINAPAGFAVAAGSAAAMVAIRFAPRPIAIAADSRAELAAQTSAAMVSAPDLVVAAVPPTQTQCSIDEIAQTERTSAASTGWLHLVTMAVTGLAIFGISQVVGQVDPVLAGVLALAPLALIEPLDALIDAEKLRSDVVQAEARLTQLAARVAEADPARDIARCTALPDRLDLRLDQVSVGWSHTGSEPITLELPHGTAAALTGPSGVGKSTLALAITRFLDPLAGTITLGGIDIGSLPIADVRSRIGLLSQDEMVFDTTVRENLRVAKPDADDDQMRTALQSAGLASWLDQTADGLDTAVGERGSALSGGEKQRLCLARLLLGGHRVLVLDEPTEHLDRQHAERLLDDIFSLVPQLSVLIISHDPRVLRRVSNQCQMRPRSWSSISAA